MLPQSISDFSHKREAFVRIGEHKVRVPSDLHSRLVQFCDERRYSKQFDGLLYAASVGLRVLQTTESIKVINVDNP